MDVQRSGRLSRRELISGGAAVAATAALGVGQARADAPVPDAATLLTKALEYERLSVLAYEHLIGLPALSAHQRRVLRALVHQDRAHARALTAAMAAGAIALPPAPAGPAAVDQALSAKGMSGGLASVTTLKAAVQLLLDIEALTEGAYYMIVRDFDDPATALRAAQILANEAQHSMQLSELVSPDVRVSVPNWYVTGVT